MGRKPSNTPKKARASLAGLGGGSEKVQRDMTAEQHKVCMSKIIEALRDNPPKALRVMAALQSGFFDKDSSQSAQETDQWPKTYVWFRQVGKYWLAGWLVKNIPGMTAELCDLVDEDDPWGLRKLVDYGCGTIYTQKLPRPCLSKLVLGVTLQRRYVARGRLLDDFAEKYINKNTGAIAWERCGAWRLLPVSPENLAINRIVYRPRNETFDITAKGWLMDSTWVVSNNWHDHAAFTEKDIAKVIFADQLGVNLNLPGTFAFESFNTDAKAYAAELEVKHETEAALVVPVDPTMVTVKKRKKAPGDASATPLALTSA